MQNAIPCLKRGLVVVCAVSMMIVTPAQGEQEQIADLHGLPRVLIVGDQIAESYVPSVRERLADMATVRFDRLDRSADGVAVMDRALEDDPWDVVVFNVGLNDAELDEDGLPKVAPAEYAIHLRAMVERLVETSPSYKIFLTTAPAPMDAHRWAGDAITAYNALARSMMRPFLISVTDVYARMTERPEWRRPNSAVPTDEGVAYLAGLVAEAIEDGLY